MPTTDETAAVHQPTRPDGRLRALYAATAAGVDIAGVLVQAVCLLCVFGLIVLVGSIVAAAVQAIVWIRRFRTFRSKPASSGRSSPVPMYEGRPGPGPPDERRGAR